MDAVKPRGEGDDEFRLDNPALESIGVRITQWRDDYVELELPLAPNMLNRSRVVHGGTLCTLLDAATGYSGLYSAPGEAARHAVTLSLTSNFLSNGTGKLLTAKGMVDGADARSSLRAQRCGWTGSCWWQRVSPR